MRMSSFLRELPLRLSMALRGGVKVLGGDIRKAARVRTSARAVEAASGRGGNSVRKAWLYTGAASSLPLAMAGYVLLQEQGEDLTEYPAENGDESPVETGLGAEVDELANKSPFFRKVLNDLIADGWTIEYDSGAYTFRSGKAIGVDLDEKNNPEEVIVRLAHEMGHAYDGRFEWSYEPPHPGMKKEEWLRQNVFKNYQDEAHSELVSSRVLHEIHQNGGPDIVPEIQNKFPNRSADLYRQVVEGNISWEDARSVLARELMADGRRWPGMREKAEKFYDDIYASSS